MALVQYFDVTLQGSACMHWMDHVGVLLIAAIEGVSPSNTPAHHAFLSCVYIATIHMSHHVYP